MSARDDILARVHQATQDGRAPGSGGRDSVAGTPVPRDYRPADKPGDESGAESGVGSETEPGEGDLLALLTDRLSDYRASVHRATPASAPAVVAQAIAERGARRLVVPGGLPADVLTALTGAGVELIPDQPPLTPAELDATDGVLTLSRLAVAETGTIVLDAGPGQGRRILTLVPDYHLCVVAARDVVRGVPEAVAALGASDPTRPLTWISGPSATSDIELQRVEGVHGPRTLVVVLVAEFDPTT